MEAVFCLLCGENTVLKHGEICRVCLDGGKPAQTPKIENSIEPLGWQIENILGRYPEIMQALAERAHDQIRTTAEQLVFELREVLK